MKLVALAEQLKLYREKSGLSQASVAEELKISRQQISKWENGRGYPDIDNLVLLSKLYQVSIDELLQENEQLKEQIQKNNVEIEDKKKKLSFITQQMSSDKDEGLILLLLAGVSSFIFPLGILLSGFAIWRNKKTNSFYRLVYIVCAIALLLNLYDGYVHVANVMNWGTTTIEQVDQLPAIIAIAKALVKKLSSALYEKIQAKKDIPPESSQPILAIKS